MTSALALVDRLRGLPPAERHELYEQLGLDLGAVEHDWPGFWSRPDQRVEPRELEQHGLVVFAGPRGCGKTRGAVELFNREIFEGRAHRPRIFAANEADVDKTVVHGPSGIMACLPADRRPQWIRAEGPAGVLRYPNGVEVVCFSARAPEGAVSSQGDLDLYDDVAKWGPHAETAWRHARASCRLGYSVGIVATTRRGTSMLRRLLRGDLSGVLLRRPDDPRANRNNLSAKYFRQMETEFDGTDFFAQELDDQEIAIGSPFDGIDFAELRAAEPPRAAFRHVGIGVDPATSSATYSCEVGIVVGGIDLRDQLWALRDLSAVMSASQWPEVVAELIDDVQASYVVFETNKGGGMGPELIRQAQKLRRIRSGKPGISTIEIRERTARIGKARRAAPLRQVYLAGQARHVAGLGPLERQLRELTDDEATKADRADAWVWLARELAGVMEDAQPEPQTAELLERLKETHAGRPSVERVGVPGLLTFPNLPPWDPRSQRHPTRRGIGSKRVL